MRRVHMESVATSQDGREIQQNILNGVGALGPGKRRCRAAAHCARQSRGRTHRQWDKNNLYSLNGLVKEGYIPIFERDGFKV